MEEKAGSKEKRDGGKMDRGKWYGGKRERGGEEEDGGKAPEQIVNDPKKN